jgi:hypothetical protein
VESPKLSVYPNPTSSVVNVQLPQSVSEAALYISDINGKVVHEQTLNSNKVVPLDVSKLEQGVYILRVVSDGNQWQERIIKQ